MGGQNMELAFALVASNGGCASGPWQMALDGLKATPLDRQDQADAWVSLANCIGRIMHDMTVH